MGFLPPIGVFSYNGFVFNGSTKSKVNTEFLLDPAGRTVKASLYKIWASTTIVNDGASTDIPMALAQQQLSKAGQQLIYNGQGNGGFSINVAGARDVMWGPIPKTHDFKSIGGAQAYSFEWTCTVAIPACAGAVYQNVPMAFTFEVDIEIDGDGYTTRTVRGELEIPMTRVIGGASIPDVADKYWDQVCPTIPTGFKRERNGRNNSRDKRTLTFECVDVQIPGGGYPPGVTDFEGIHVVSPTNPPDTTRYMSTLSATYVIAPGAPRNSGAVHFFEMAKDRASVSQAAGTQLYGWVRGTEGLGKNRRMTYELDWVFVSNIVDCFSDGGQFRPVPNIDWQTWLNSIGVASAQSPYGFSGLVLSPTDDAIVDLCLNQNVSILRKTATVDERLQSGTPPVTDTVTLQSQNSWLKYECRIETGGESNLVRLKRMGPFVPTATGLGDYDAQGSPSTVSLTSGGLDATQQTVPQANTVGAGTLVNTQATNPPTDLFQQLGSPSYTAILRGYAIRAGYKIPLPMLTTVGGANAMPGYQWASSDTVIANLSGVPIYHRAWHLEYNLDQLPDSASVVTPANPASFVPPN